MSKGLLAGFVADDLIDREAWLAQHSPASRGGVTRHDDEDCGIKPATKRKQEQRERDVEAGVDELRVRIGPTEAAQLAEGLEFRALGGEPYTATEYLLTLIRRDNELLRQQRGVVENKICEQCRKPLPRGCGGVWAGELSCALPPLKRALEL
jgi:hypothetical protein